MKVPEYRGEPVSEGVAVGKVYLYRPYVPKAARKDIPAGRTGEAIARYEGMLAEAKRELEALRSRLEKAGETEKAKIFTAHIDILLDVVMDEEIRDGISHDLLSPEWAVRQVYGSFIRALEKAADSLIRERAADIRDVENRLLRVAEGAPETSLAALDRPAVVVAGDLLPSDTAGLDPAMVLAIVTETGGYTSHSAIMARSCGIPALLGVKGIAGALAQGQEVAVDALEGVLIPDPSDEVKEAMDRKAEAFRRRRAQEQVFLETKPRMADGRTVPVLLNMASADERELSWQRYTDGSGLFRTEFLYMGRKRLPTEDEQYAIYRRTLLAFGERPVVLRTLDVGGDKKLPTLALPAEENPFLGSRALRLCFQRPELFLTQLRAALRASAYGKLRIMFPMVGSIDDIRRAKETVAQAKEQLDRQGQPYDPEVPLGIMVEIPAIAAIADLAAQEADFASIGTNDLTQYALAADRMNPQVAGYYQSYHPAVFRLVRQVAEAFAQNGKPVGVCGELGGDPLAAAVLVGLGVNSLSMNPASVARIKKLLSGLTMARARELADTVCGLPTDGEVRRYLERELAPLL